MSTNNQESPVSSRKERPILFSGPMVMAILDCRKTQARRVVKVPQSTLDVFFDDECDSTFCSDKPNGMKDPFAKMICCPYGQPGDRLWVRESFRIRGGDEYAYQKHQGSVVYREGCEIIDDGPWHPSIYMPRWASRITLEIEAVRVERVHDISEDDAQAEGVDFSANVTGIMFGTFRGAFSRLWDSINAGRGFGWDTNPWVWVIQFKRV